MAISATCSSFVGSQDTKPLTNSSIDFASITPPRWSGAHPTAGPARSKGAGDEHRAEEADGARAHDRRPGRHSSRQPSVHRRAGLDRPEPDRDEDGREPQAERENEHEA